MAAAPQAWRAVAALTMAAAVAWAAVGCSSSEGRLDEEGQWKFFCAHTIDAPSVAVEREFSLAPAGYRTFVDQYVLAFPPDDFPSAVREPLLSLRDTIHQFRDGAISAEEARDLARVPIEQLHQHDGIDGECGELRSRF